MVASLQRNNTLALNVSVQDRHVKKYGPSTDIYYGRVVAEALGSFVSYTAAPVGPRFWHIEYISYVDPIRKGVAVKMVRFNHEDIKLRQEILSVRVVDIILWRLLTTPPIRCRPSQM